jgi:HlyD family secretion protein
VANVAVEQQDGKHWVQVRNGRGFERREVELGVRGTARSQVLTGLNAGDEVLLSPGGVELPLKPVGEDAAGADVAAGDAAPTSEGAAQ